MTDVKVGSRVRVTEIEDCDKGYVSVGDVGIVTELGEEGLYDNTDVFYVAFDEKDGSQFQGADNVNDDGTYQMFRYQLEVVE